MNRGNSFCNGPVPPSAYNGAGPIQVRHGWHCPCRWCLVGHK